MQNNLLQSRPLRKLQENGWFFQAMSVLASSCSEEEKVCIVNSGSKTIFFHDVGQVLKTGVLEVNKKMEKS